MNLSNNVGKAAITASACACFGSIAALRPMTSMLLLEVKSDKCAGRINVPENKCAGKINVPENRRVKRMLMTRSFRNSHVREIP